MDALTNKRGSVKGRITRIESSVLQQTKPATLLQLTDTDVALYLDKVDKLTTELNTIQELINNKCRPEDFETHNNEYLDLGARLEDLERLLLNAKNQRQTAAANLVPVTKPTADIRLPPIDLPKFGGNYIEWFPFHDLFLATVHNNSLLSGAQKLHYLKNATYGDAALLIHSLQLTDGNYSEAWDILKNRFHNTREIVDAHVKRLFTQPTVKEESSTALRRLIDTTSECIRSLKVLQEPVEHWDAVLIHIVKEKLDAESRRQWELSLSGTNRPKYDELSTFLEQRARALAASQPVSSSQRSKEWSQPRKFTTSHHGSVKGRCAVCTEDHPVYRCPTLLKATTEDRWATIKKHTLCFNCLSSDHQSNDCKRGSCKICNAKHHTLLHRQSQEPRKSNSEVNVHVSRELSPIPLRNTEKPQVLLPTAIIQVKEISGQFQPLRALLDSASQATFITEQGMKKLQLKRSRCNLSIGGIGATGVGTARGCVQLDIMTEINHTISVEALILNKVTENLPSSSFNPSDWSHIKGLKLADSTFYVPGPIDVLLGADIYFDIIEEGKVHGRRKLPVAFKTVFGWALGGSVHHEAPRTITVPIEVHICTLDEQLTKFWELEEVTTKTILTSEEKQCELEFAATHSRSTSGRFIVRLPFKSDPKQLGDSKKTALRRFLYNERRLQSDPDKHQQYCDFIEDYIRLGHMEHIHPNENSTSGYYLPHHAVIKEASTTTKLRVVFDASAKSATGQSLNDMLLVGPKLQDDLINLLIRFRSFPIVMTADIAKMYRQILVHPDDTKWQKIIWREDPSKPLQEYKLKTVTYGTAAAPYLATKVLQQLSEGVKEQLPLASAALAQDFYMDDLMTGVMTRREGFQFQKEILKATTDAGFELRKWTSNDSALLESLPPKLREIQGPLRIDNDETIKTLGLNWTPAPDHFTFVVTSPPTRTSITKRTVLSDTAKVFDPLGLLAPVTILAKLLLQDMWQVKIDWDEQLPPQLIKKWREFREDLPQIEKITISRYISQPEIMARTLHGFCDASEKAIAAAVYLKTISTTGQTYVQLIAAKTKVAPLKKTTLPRLELTGAVLLAKLIKLVQRSIKEEFTDIQCWTDSTIVLAWIRSPPHRWKTFVANRVSEVQELVPKAHWNHVSGETNPADCASRGILARELQNHPLWWKGPRWLQTFTTSKIVSFPEEPKDCFIEEKITGPLVAHCQVHNSILAKFSSFRTLIIVQAYILRYWHNLRISKGEKEPRRTGVLTAEERELALLFWVKKIQQDVFHEEIELLRQKKNLPTKSKLVPLCPFLDSRGILRVGGRLHHAKVSTDKIHPMLLPRRNKFTDLIIDHEHIKHLHGGPQLLTAVLQRKFWIFGIRDAVRFHVRRCIRCVRQQAATTKQLMGNLPAVRVNPGRAFLNCGVDYAGPFTLRVLKGRGQKTFKGYVALFACFTTRALHLELVSDMSTEAFLAAFKRFISRRGKCAHIYSDCGSNFIGAERELKDFMKFINSTSSNAKITTLAAEEGIEWHFNPPSAPHFGGLLKAGVKSVKYHLRRVIGATTLNFEEFQTLLCQVEACLNSRPLTSLSADPSDLSALTPGHFLIGGPLTAVPEPDLTSEKLNRLTRWQLAQRLLQHFWRRWSQEYLSRLQQRPKWASPVPNLKVGDLVLIKEDNMPPPTKWKMG